MALATLRAVPSSKLRAITVTERGVWGFSKPQRATTHGWPHALVRSSKSPANGGATTASNCINHVCIVSMARRRKRDACSNSMAGINHAWRNEFGQASSACHASASSVFPRVSSSKAAAPSATTGSMRAPESTSGGFTSTRTAPASRSASRTG